VKRLPGSEQRLPGSDRGLFTFDDKWWARIVPTLPPLLLAQPETAKRRTRRFLERIFQEYRDYPANPRVEVERWRKVEECSRRLRSAVKVATAHAEYLQWLLGLLSGLEREASAVADDFELYSMPTVKGRRVQRTRRPNREVLFGDLMKFWEFHDGLLQYSYDGDTPTGPLVRFLEAALSGLDKPPKPSAIADIINRELNRRDRPSISAPGRKFRD
jgi:hypothetical protein